MSTPSDTGIFKIIGDSYWELAMKHCQVYVNTSCKIARQQQHTAFNTRCHGYNFNSLSLQVKSLVNTADGRQVAWRTSQWFLSARIDENYRTLRKLQPGCSLCSTGNSLRQKRDGSINLTLWYEHVVVIKRYGDTPTIRTLGCYFIVQEIRWSPKESVSEGFEFRSSY